MIYGLDDIRMRRVFIEEENSGEDRRRREHQRLGALIGYCETPSCRRRTLLAYFGEDSGDCGNCDMCLDPADISDGTDEARGVLSVVRATGQRFGAGHVVDVLRGATSEKVTRVGHDCLAEFATGAGRISEEWRSIIRQLVAAGFLYLDVAEFGGLKLTERGRALLGGQETFQYRRDVVDRPAGRSRKMTAPVSTQALTDPEAALLRRLKDLRADIARSRRVPAYVVFTDKALMDMARKLF